MKPFFSLFSLFSLIVIWNVNRHAGDRWGRTLLFELLLRSLFQCAESLIFLLSLLYLNRSFFKFEWGAPRSREDTSARAPNLLFFIKSLSTCRTYLLIDPFKEALELSCLLLLLLLGRSWFVELSNLCLRFFHVLWVLFLGNLLDLRCNHSWKVRCLLGSVRLISLIDSINEIRSGLQCSFHLLWVHSCFDSWLLLPLCSAIREDEHLFVDLILVQNLVRCINHLLRGLISFICCRIEVVGSQVGVHWLSKIRHRLSPISNDERPLHRGIEMFSEVSWVAHIEVGIGEVCRIDELWDEDAYLVACFRGQDDISVTYLRVIKPWIHLGSIRITRVTPLCSLHLYGETIYI